MAAIYMWFEDVEVEYTTPLYPLEIDTGITLTLDINFMDNWQVTTDGAEGSRDFIGGSRQDVLIDLPLEVEAAEGGRSFTGGSREDRLIILPTEVEAAEGGVSFAGGSRVDLLIRVYTPSENLALTVDLAPSYWVMAAA